MPSREEMERLAAEAALRAGERLAAVPGEYAEWWTRGAREKADQFNRIRESRSRLQDRLVGALAGIEEAPSSPDPAFERGSAWLKEREAAKRLPSQEGENDPIQVGPSPFEETLSELTRPYPARTSPTSMERLLWGEGMQRGGTEAAPAQGRGSVLRTPDGRIVLTNQPGQYEDAEDVSDWAAGALASKQTSANMAGPFRIGGEMGTKFTPGFSQYEMPKAEDYAGLSEADYTKLRSQESPLVQSLMDEERTRAQSGTLDELRIQAARERLDPAFVAKQQLAVQDELRKRAQEDPGVQLLVIQNLNAWRQKNPDATPDQVAQMKQALTSQAISNYVQSNDPELQIARARTGF